MGKRLVAAIAIAAQVAALALTASPLAFASLCPVHMGLVQQADHATPDHRQTAPEDSEQGPLHPMIFSFACCASHMVGVFSLPAVDAPARGAALPLVEAAETLAPGELSGADPPPRSLL